MTISSNNNIISSTVAGTYFNNSTSWTMSRKIFGSREDPELELQCDSVLCTCAYVVISLVSTLSIQCSVTSSIIPSAHQVPPTLCKMTYVHSSSWHGHHLLPMKRRARNCCYYPQPPRRGGWRPKCSTIIAYFVLQEEFNVYFEQLTEDQPPSLVHAPSALPALLRHSLFTGGSILPQLASPWARKMGGEAIQALSNLCRRICIRGILCLTWSWSWSITSSNLLLL